MVVISCVCLWVKSQGSTMFAACRGNFQLCQHVTQHQHPELHNVLYHKLSLLATCWFWVLWELDLSIDRQLSREISCYFAAGLLFDWSQITQSRIKSTEKKEKKFCIVDSRHHRMQNRTEAEKKDSEAGDPPTNAVSWFWSSQTECNASVDEPDSEQDFQLSKHRGGGSFSLNEWLGETQQLMAIHGCASDACRRKRSFRVNAY